MGLVAGWSSKLDLPVKMPLTSSAKWLLPYFRLIFASESPYTQVLPSYTFFKKNPSKGKRCCTTYCFLMRLIFIFLITHWIVQIQITDKTNLTELTICCSSYIKKGLQQSILNITNFFKNSILYLWKLFFRKKNFWWLYLVLDHQKKKKFLCPNS